MREVLTELNVIQEKTRVIDAEFIINDHIKLKLINNKTVIFVDDMPFNHCKYLLLDVPLQDFESANDVNSIDDAAEKLDRSLERRIWAIEPETEFWGHCSNIQAWSESGYDTRLLHRNLAFPLLKILSKKGDLIAKHRFKEEIAERFESGNINVMRYLIEEKYLDYLNIEEVKSLFLDSNSKLGENIEKILTENVKIDLPLLKKLMDVGDENVIRLLIGNENVIRLLIKCLIMQERKFLFLDSNSNLEESIDLKTKNAFKEKFVTKFINGDRNVRHFLFEAGLFSLLNDEERKSLFIELLEQENFSGIRFLYHRIKIDYEKFTNDETSNLLFEFNYQFKTKIKKFLKATRIAKKVIGYLLSNISDFSISGLSNLVIIHGIIQNVYRGIDNFFSNIDNVQFPLEADIALLLLNKLYDEGDPLAIKLFKQEIANKMKCGYVRLVEYILDTDYLDYLENNEISSLLGNQDSNLYKYFYGIFNGDNHSKAGYILVLSTYLSQQQKTDFLKLAMGNIKILKLVFSFHLLDLDPLWSRDMYRELIISMLKLKRFDYISEYALLRNLFYLADDIMVDDLIAKNALKKELAKRGYQGKLPEYEDIYTKEELRSIFYNNK